MTPVRLDIRRREIVFPCRRMHVDTGPAWLLLQLASARGRPVGLDDLIWRRWGGANEPDDGAGAIHKWAFLARALLAGTDLAIGKRWGFGYYLVRQEVVGPVGVEPTTLRLRVGCSAN